MSECKKACSCQEILEFCSWGWDAAAGGTFSPQSGDRGSMALCIHPRCISLELFGQIPVGVGSRRKAIIVKLGLKRFS